MCTSRSKYTKQLQVADNDLSAAAMTLSPTRVTYERGGKGSYCVLRHISTPKGQVNQQLLQQGPRQPPSNALTLFLPFTCKVLVESRKTLPRLSPIRSKHTFCSKHCAIALLILDITGTQSETLIR